MNYIKEISFYMNDRSEDSNKKLASRIVDENLNDAVNEIATYLFDKNKTIASDCIAVLYHVGYEKPEMIYKLTEVFFNLLSNRNNRMVWGAMIALTTISTIAPKEIHSNIEKIYKAFNEGSLITQIWAYKSIVNISSNPSYYDIYIDFLLDVLEKTRPVDFTKRATLVGEIVRDNNKKRYLTILEEKEDLSKSSSRIIQKLIDVNKKNL